MTGGIVLLGCRFGASTGRLSKQALGFDHDATRCPAGAAPPIDLVEIGTVRRTP